MGLCIEKKKDTIMDIHNRFCTGGVQVIWEEGNSGGVTGGWKG